MSYVIQNFFVINSALRLTYRKYFFWLLKSNNKAITNYLFRAQLFYTSTLGSPTYSLFKVFFFAKMFNRSIQKHFSSSTLLWKPLLETQAVRGFEFWAFRSTIINLDRKSTITPIIQQPLKSRLFLNQILLEKRYTKMLINDRTYRVIFNNFTKLLITSWYVWRPSYKLTLNALLLNEDWLILKRFNTRFFKLLSI